MNEGEHALRPASVVGGPEVAEAKVMPSVFTLRVTGLPAEAQFTLDGEAAGSGTLVRQLPKDGKAHVLELSAAGFETKRVTFTDANAPSEVVLSALPAIEEQKQEAKGAEQLVRGAEEPKSDKHSAKAEKRVPKAAVPRRPRRRPRERQRPARR